MLFVLLIISLIHGKYVMLYPSIFPFSYEPGGRVYWILLTIELFTNFFIWSAASGIDAIFAMYTMHKCREFRVLALKFESLTVSENYRDALKDCVERHHQLMKAKEVFQNLFGFLTIYVAITSAIILCIIIFQAIQLFKTMGLGLIYVVAYITFKLVQAFIYTRSRIVSKRCTTHSVAETTSLSRAKGCMTLKMEILIKILNTSVSYFFLLQTLDEGSRH